MKLTDEQILALNHGEVYFSESPSKYPEAGHGTQYHCGAPGLLKFARALLALAAQPSVCPDGLTDAEIDTIAESMPGGLDGFLKGWGWRNFARAVEAEVMGAHPGHSGDGGDKVLPGEFDNAEDMIAALRATVPQDGNEWTQFEAWLRKERGRRCDFDSNAGSWSRAAWQAAIASKDGPVRAALKLLLDLKRHKDMRGKDAYYEARQPAAWVFAHHALAGRLDGDEAVSADGGMLIEHSDEEMQRKLAPVAAANPVPRTHTTQPGESVMGIALRQCGNEKEWRHILACNPKFAGMLPHDYFPVGTVLDLPPEAAEGGEK